MVWIARASQVANAGIASATRHRLFSLKGCYETQEATEAETNRRCHYLEGGDMKVFRLFKPCPIPNCKGTQVLKIHVYICYICGFTTHAH